MTNFEIGTFQQGVGSNSDNSENAAFEEDLICSIPVIAECWFSQLSYL